MNRLTEGIRETGRKIIDGSTILGFVPCISAAVIAGDIVENRVPDFVRIGIVAVAGITSYQVSHNFFGTEFHLSSDPHFRTRNPIEISQEQF